MTELCVRDVRDGTRPFLPRPARVALLLGSTALAMAFAGGTARALPQGGTVVEGDATITYDDHSVVIEQNSDRIIIEWDRFDIAAHERVDFDQTDLMAALNRVLTGEASQILGSLNAGGQITIVNPAGIHFGAGAQVDVGAITATTLGILNDHFLAGDLVFDQYDPAQGSASVVNDGTITVGDRGLAALVAPGVSNSGVIQARSGAVVLASGTAFTVDFYGDGLINFAVTAPTEQIPVDGGGTALPALVSNSGAIYVDGGTVILTADAVGGVVDNAINMDGIISARAIDGRSGQIALVVGDGAGDVAVAGQLDASGAESGSTGGTVHVLGDTVALAAGADINASGPVGGGAVLIGGGIRGGDASAAAIHYHEVDAITWIEVDRDFDAGTYVRTSYETYVDDAAAINVDATETGDGGMVVVWSDDNTEFHGAISARGARQGGDGGFVEVSGAALIFAGLADRSAAQGQDGVLLLDPNVLRVSPLADGTAGNTQTVNDATLNANLALGDVVLQADSRIIVEAGTAVDTQANDLYFDAVRVQLFADIVGNVDGGAAGGAAAAALIGGPLLPGVDPSRVDVAGTSLRGIQQALEISGDGARIDVGAGVYGDPSDAVNGRAPLVIDHAVTLRGAQATVAAAGRTAGGAGETVLDFASATGVGGAGVAIRVTASDVRIDGFDIVADADQTAVIRIQDGSGGATPVENTFIFNSFIRPDGGAIGGYGVVTVTTGAYRNIQVRNSDISGTDREGIRLSGVDDVVIRSNVIAQTGRDAIKLTDVGSAARPSLQIIDNTIGQVTGDGIEIDTIAGPLVIRGNEFEGVTGDGANVNAAQGDVSVIDNRMTDIGGSAVEIDAVTAGGTARVVDNIFDAVGGDGVDINNVDGFIRVDDNVIANTDGDGIQIVDGGAIVQVAGNRVSNSNAANNPAIQRDLIDISDVVGTVRVRDNVLDNADDNAIEIRRLQSRLIIADNTITTTRRDDGIDVGDVVGPARLTRNSVTGVAENGISVSNTQRVTVDNNDVFGNAAVGIVVANSPVSQVVDNAVFDNANDGIAVAGDGGVTRIARNLITGNGRHGVRTVGLDRATIDSNVIGGIVAQPGSVDGPSAPAGNADDGINSVSVSDLRIHNNHLNFNGGDGVDVAVDSGRLDARENFVHLNNGNGVGLTGGLTDTAINNNSIVGNGGLGLEDTGANTIDAAFNWWGTAVPAAVVAQIASAGSVVSDPFYQVPDDINGPNGLVAPTGLGPFAFQGGAIIAPPVVTIAGDAPLAFDASALLIPRDEDVTGRNLQTPGDDAYFRLPEDFGYGADIYAQTYGLGQAAAAELGGLAPAAGGGTRQACGADPSESDDSSRDDEASGVDFEAPIEDGLRVECAFDPERLEPAAGGVVTAGDPATGTGFIGSFMTSTYLGAIGWFDQPG